MADTRKTGTKAIRLAPHIIIGSALALLLVVGGGGWAATARLNGAVVSQGAVKIEQNLKEVQHRDGGIVQHIAVRQGDTVSEGQVLFRLDDVQIRAELSIVRSQLAENLGRQARLVAERDNLPAIAFPPGLADLSDESGQIVSGEVRLFEGNRTNRQSRKEQLEIGIVQTGEELRGLESRRIAKVEEVRLVQAEREKYTSLFTRGLVDAVRVFNINREWARLLGEQGEIEATIARTKLRATDLKLQIMAIDETARTEAQRELRQVEARISELGDRRVAIEDRLARTVIRAPSTGIVNELTVFTVGGVITPAARLATIVPHQARLTVEVRISPADIDQVRIGQTARMRFTAFNRNTTPEVAGHVIHLSPATSRDTVTGQTYYTGEIATDTAVTALQGRRLLPGMPVEVYISTEDRTALSFLVKPLADHANRMFRER